MRIYGFTVTFLIVLTFKYNVARRQYNQNADFLLHEAGVPGNNPAPPKRDYVAQQTSTTKKEDFPPLGPSLSTVTTPRTWSTPQATRPTQSSGKRDYVAPNFPPLKPPANSQNFPALGPSSSTQTTGRPLSSPQPSRPTQSTGKRDYVAPSFPSTKPPQQGTGKVKDIINFYESKDKQTNGPNKVPSYNNILQGSTTKVQNTVTQSTPKVITTPKPLSFSSIVAGSNRPTVITTGATSKPSTISGFTTSLKPGNNINSAATSRPLVLPSSIGNGNQGNNGNKPSDSELKILSEELLKRDTNNAAKYVTINYQEKTTSQSTEDKAPLPLLTVSSETWNIPTIQKLLPLLDNYERDTLVNEHVTAQERNEENAFMDAIMSTTVIRHLMTFLKDKGYVSPDPRQQRDFLKQMWFGLYSRGKGKLSSSGFEHIFVSELKNKEVSGLHNWIYFSKEEQANRLNYLGYLKYKDFGDKGAVIKFHINQQGTDKPVDTLFIGTSPELEMALYTLCYVTRVGDDCNIKLAGKDVNIVTHNFRYRSKNYIGSGYPQI